MAKQLKHCVWSNQGLVNTARDVWVIDVKDSLEKAKLLISLCCSNPEMFCILVSSARIWP